MTYRPDFSENNFRCPANHYEIKIAGKKLLYAYIRKNACSTFKRLINKNIHPKYAAKRLLGREKYGRNHIGGNMKYYSVKNNSRLVISQYDEVIFVFRDPISRFISVFTNKFIDDSGATDIKNNFEALTDIPIERATFNDFIIYSKNDFHLLDCHMWPQKAHLWDIEYSLPISISELSGKMSDCIGKNKSEKWFGQKTNLSKTDGNILSTPLNDANVAELRALQQKGNAIHKFNFITDEIESYIKDRYQMDISMLSAIDGH